MLRINNNGTERRPQLTLTETKGLPVGELGKIFGDDEVQVHASDLRMKLTTHEVVEVKRAHADEIEDVSHSNLDGVVSKV